MILKKVGESLLALIIGILTAYVFVCLYAFLWGDFFLFATRPPTYSFGGDYISIETAGKNKIALLFLENPTARYTILYSHGNLEDIGFIRPRMELFRRHGFSVLCYDYPGFGASEGKKNEENCYDAAKAAYDYLTQILKIQPSRIILYGRSMGGGPTAYLAEKYPCAGVVMHSTFVSAFRVQTGLKILSWDRFENLQRIPQIKRPMLFVHGLSDETIPVWHTRMMIACAKAPTMKLLVPYALHNNVVEMAQENYWDVLRDFVALIEKQS
jgi:pimeloyl-ACP methyl ester carboxylesterase